MKEAPLACSANYAPLTRRGFLEIAATSLADKLYTVFGDDRFSRKEEPHRRYVFLAYALLELIVSRRDIQLLDPDAGDTDNVVKNEVDQAPFTSANPNTHPNNCSLKDQISLMYASLQADMKSLKVEMKREFDNYARKLRDVHGDGSVNVSENKVRQASIPFANPNYNCCPEKECDAFLRDLEKLSQPINHDNMPREALDQNQINHSTTQNHTSPSNPSNVALNQQSQVMPMTRTPIAVVANDAMPLRSSPHAPLMHQVEEPQGVSNVPMHQPQPIMRQFNSQLYNHLPNPTVQLSPQVPSSVPVVHMPLPVNHFNHQHNVTPPVIPIASMSMTSHLPQPDHMSSAMTGLPQIPSSSPFRLVPHYSTPQNHVGHPVPPLTHQYNPQNMSNVVQYNPHHELLSQMISPEFSSDVWLHSYGQHSVNHQPYSDLEAPNDGQTIINKGKPWSDDEHNLFLKGVDKHGKGNWKEISKNFVRTRTPAQIASHAQKYFDRLENNEENNNDNNNRASKRKKKKHPG